MNEWPVVTEPKTMHIRDVNAERAYCGRTTQQAIFVSPDSRVCKTCARIAKRRGGYVGPKWVGDRWGLVDYVCNYTELFKNATTTSATNTVHITWRIAS